MVDYKISYHEKEVNVTVIIAKYFLKNNEITFSFHFLPRAVDVQNSIRYVYISYIIKRERETYTHSIIYIYIYYKYNKYL